MSAKKVGFIGLGEMGLPMAINLHKAGYKVYGYDVVKAVYAKTEPQGIISCQTIAEVAQNTDIIISLVRDIYQTEAVIFGKEGILDAGKKGQTIIVMSTLDPGTIKKLEEKVKAVGYSMIDAPISGGKTGAEAGTLTILAAGENAEAKCDGIFRAMGKNVFYFSSEVGPGQAAKLANNLVLAIAMVGYVEGMQFAKQNNLDEELFNKLITCSTGNSWTAQNWALVKSWWAEYFPNNTLDIVYKDMFAIIKSCGETKHSLPMGGLAFQLLRDVYKKS